VDQVLRALSDLTRRSVLERLSVRPASVSDPAARFKMALCFLDVALCERLFMMAALQGGYRPSANSFFTAVVEMERRGAGAFYRAVAIHADNAARKEHEQMGFHDGWGTVLTQMVEYIKAGHVSR
jgi:uncharacterized protein YndB with AHSA1/START domain